MPAQSSLASGVGPPQCSVGRGAVSRGLGADPNQKATPPGFCLGSGRSLPPHPFPLMLCRWAAPLASKNNTPTADFISQKRNHWETLLFPK